MNLLKVVEFQGRFIKFQSFPQVQGRVGWGLAHFLRKCFFPRPISCHSCFALMCWYPLCLLLAWCIAVSHTQHLPDRDAHIGASPATLGNATVGVRASLAAIWELPVCHYAGHGSAWVVALPFRMTSTAIGVVWNTVTWPIRLLWRSIFRPVLAYLWSWICWICGPVVYLLTHPIITYIPKKLVHWLWLSLTWLWYLVSLVLQVPWYLIKNIITVLWLCIWGVASWLPTFVPVLAIGGLVVAYKQFEHSDRIEPHQRRYFLLAAGVLFILWVSYLLSSFWTLVAVVGVPASIYLYFEIPKHAEVGKKRRVLVAAGSAIVCVFLNSLLQVGIALICCPFAFISGYSHFLPSWVTGVTGHNVLAGILSLVLTVALFILVSFVRHVIVPLLLNSWWVVFCKNRQVLKPPSVMFKTLTTDSAQYSSVLQSLEGVVPAERVDGVLAVSVQHMREQYAQLRGAEATGCVPVSEKQMDCPLCMTHSWCPSSSCRVCSTCDSGPAPRVWGNPWVALSELDPTLQLPGNTRCLVICRAKPAGTPALWWRIGGAHQGALWVRRRHVLPAFVVLLAPAGAVRRPAGAGAVEQGPELQRD